MDSLSPSSLFQDSVICVDLWSRLSDPDASYDRLSVAVSLSPSLTNALTPWHCGPLGGLSSWLAPYLIPPWVVKLSLPALDACCA